MQHEIYRVTSVSVVGSHSLFLEFNDGTSQTVNLEAALEGELYKSLRDPDIFRQVYLDPEIHTVVWPNGADFDPATLHDWPSLEKEWQTQTSQLKKVAEENVPYGSQTRE